MSLFHPLGNLFECHVCDEGELACFRSRRECGGTDIPAKRHAPGHLLDSAARGETGGEERSAMLVGTPRETELEQEVAARVDVTREIGHPERAAVALSVRDEDVPIGDDGPLCLGIPPPHHDAGFLGRDECPGERGPAPDKRVLRLIIERVVEIHFPMLGGAPMPSAGNEVALTRARQRRRGAARAWATDDSAACSQSHRLRHALDASDSGTRHGVTLSRRSAVNERVRVPQRRRDVLAS